MKWNDIKSRNPVLEAIAEFDALGRERFLEKYGYGKSTRLFVRHDGKQYDIKALAGVTHGYADAAVGPLKHNEFSSGKSLVNFFERLGFDVVDKAATTAIEQAVVFRNAIQKLLSGYLDAKSTQITNTSPMWDAIKRAESALQQLTAEYPHVKVRSSVGKGNWAAVPWIALLDDRITDTTRRGVYGVYLFRTDMTGVYVTFNQGVTDVKQQNGWPTARKILAETANALRDRYRQRFDPSFTSADGIARLTFNG